MGGLNSELSSKLTPRKHVRRWVVSQRRASGSRARACLGVREPGRGARLYSGDAVEFRQAYGFQTRRYIYRSVSTVRARSHARFEISRVLLLCSASIWTSISNARTEKENHPYATRSIAGACLPPGLPRGRGSGLNCESPPARPSP
jgi:hypothetical protein